MFSEQNQRVFVYEDNLWTIKGRYEAAMDDDDDEWSILQDQFHLRLTLSVISSTQYTPLRWMMTDLLHL